MKQLVFQHVSFLKSFRLQVATKSTATLIQLLLEQWNVKHNTSYHVTSYHNTKYPTSLEQEQFDQLLKVYTSCIHFTQYIPLLFTQINAQIILESGTYCAKKQQWYKQYPILTKYNIAQHYKYIPIMSVYFH